MDPNFFFWGGVLFYFNRNDLQYETSITSKQHYWYMLLMISLKVGPSFQNHETLILKCKEKKRRKNVLPILETVFFKLILNFIYQ